MEKMYCVVCGKEIMDGIDFDGEYYCRQCYEDNIVECAECNELMHIDDAKEYDGEYYCDTCYHDNFTTCDRCGEIVPINDAREYDGEYFCEDCFDEIFTTCAWCGDIVPVDYAFFYEEDEQHYCERCINNHFVRCDNCGELVHERDILTDGTMILCNICRDDFYVCDNCGNFVHADDVYYDEDSGDYYCPTCWHDNYNSDILNYDYSPYPEFYGESHNGFYMGVELEIDGGGEDNNNAIRIKDIMGEVVYIKHDGSLKDGLEIVTHPATLEYHRHNMKWKQVLKEVRNMGYKSHDAGTCGLHVHMSRRAFGSCETEIDLNTMKLLYLFEKFWNQFVKFSRRTEEQLNRWAARYGLTAPLNSLLNTAKGAGRYHAVNLQPTYTIELRLFRGTLKYNTLIATLEFCQYLYDTVMRNDIETLQKMMWSDFVGAIPKEYEELLTYIEERDLFNIEQNNSTQNTITLYNCPICGMSNPAEDWNRSTEARFDPPVVPIEEGNYDLYYICPHCGSRVLHQNLTQYS